MNAVIYTQLFRAHIQTKNEYYRWHRPKRAFRRCGVLYQHFFAAHIRAQKNRRNVRPKYRSAGRPLDLNNHVLLFKKHQELAKKELAKERMRQARTCPQCGGPKRGASKFCVICTNANNLQAALERHEMMRAAKRRRENDWKENRRKTSAHGYIREVVKSAGKRFRKKGFPVEEVPAELHPLIPPYCPILDIHLDRSAPTSSPNKPALDHIVPELGHASTNIRFISRRANSVKSDCTDPFVFWRVALDALQNKVTLESTQDWKVTMHSMGCRLESLGDLFKRAALAPYPTHEKPKLLENVSYSLTQSS